MCGDPIHLNEFADPEEEITELFNFYWILFIDAQFSVEFVLCYFSLFESFLNVCKEI